MRNPGWRIWLVAAVSLVVGVVIGIAVVGRFDDPDWFAAAGVWFGAAATVVAIVWAVSSFTYEQNETQRRERAAREDRERARVEAAKSITVRLQTGGAQGGNGAWQMTAVHLQVINTSSTTNATEVRVHVPDLPSVKLSRDMLKPGEEWSQAQVPIKPYVPVTDAQATGAAPIESDAVVSYTFEGHRWERTNNRDPIQLN